MSTQNDREYVHWYIFLLEMEIEALRSVLSELDKDDKYQYVQMIKADKIADLKNSLVRP